MLLVTFQLGEDRYAVDASSVLAVVPLIPLRSVPRAPEGIAGILNYLGTPIPIVDLCAAMLGRLAQRWMSTRIVLSKYETPAGECRTIGFIAERATETIRIQADAFVPSGVSAPDAQYLGKVANVHGRILQLVQIERLLPEAVRGVLFAE